MRTIRGDRSTDPICCAARSTLMDQLEPRVLLAADPFTYRVYYPEGFAGPTITEFLPIANPGLLDAQYEVVARFETGNRDLVIAQGTIAAHSRAGITVTRAEDQASSLVPWGVPYALEVRSTQPLAATLSHYDFGGAAGESFVGSESLATEWTIPGSRRGSHDFVVWYNPGDTDASLTIEVFPDGGGAPTLINTTTGALRRGGLNMALVTLPNGTTEQTVHIVADQPIVVAFTSYTSHGQTGNPNAVTLLAERGPGSTYGLIPLSTAHIAPDTQFVDVYNPDSVSDLSVSFTLYYPGGTPAPATFPDTPRSVSPHSTLRLKINANDIFPGDGSIPSNTAFTIEYRASLPVFVRATNMISISAPPPAPFGARVDLLASSTAAGASTSIVFADGYMHDTRAGVDVFETLAIFNPHSANTSLGASDVQVSIKFNYSDGTVLDETFVLAPGVLRSLDIHTFEPVLAQARDHGRYFYSIDVQSDLGVVAQMWHTDFALAGYLPGGGFSSTGTFIGPLIPFGPALT